MQNFITFQELIFFLSSCGREEMKDNIFFIVVQCILESTQFTQQQMHYLLTWLKVLNLD